MKRASLVLASLLSVLAWLCLSPAHAADADEAALESRLHEFLAGASVNDRAVHDAFWAEDLVYTSSSGTRFGKADIMAGLPESPTAGMPEVRYTGEDVVVRRWGDTAVVTFRLVGTPGDGDPPTEYFNTGTFLLTSEGWRAVAWQATRIPADGPD